MLSSSSCDVKRRRTSVVNLLQKAFDVTGLAAQLDLPLTDLGLESIMAEDLAEEFNVEFDVKLRGSDFYSGRMSTISSIVEALPSLATDPVKAPQPETVPEHPAMTLPEILVTGMSCRFPGGIDSPDSFYDSLKLKKNGVSCRAPKDRPGFKKDFPGGYIPDFDRFNPAYV
jgi:hypothetical protein